MRIRKTTKEDIRKIARLLMDEFSKPPFNEETTISSVIKSLNFYFKIGKSFVAVEDKEIAGVVIFKIEQWWEAPVIIIEDLAVKEEFKKQKVGKNLINEVEEYATIIKAKAVCFTTHRKSSSLRFYTKQGYKVEKNKLFMRKEIVY